MRSQPRPPGRLTSTGDQLAHAGIAHPTLWPQEEWRAVPGYEGLYQVSSLGRVESLPRKTTKGGIRKLRTDKRGYQWVALSKDGIVRSFTVHELVALAFFGPRPAWATDIRHLDGNPSNNRASNLIYGDHSQNATDMTRHGRNQGWATKGKGKPKPIKLKREVSFTDLPGEIWRAVAGYEGYYEASTMGRIRSLLRQTAKGLAGGRLLKPGPTGQFGYLAVTLCKEGRQQRRCVHQLVAETFLGPRPDGMFVLHGSNGHLDNRVSELRYGPQKENMAQKVADGTQVRGGAHPASKLTDAMVEEIRERIEAGESSYKIAPDYSVAPSTIRAVMSGYSWKHSGPPPRPGHGRGERASAAKLTDSIVLECRRRFTQGESANSLAKQFGIGTTAMLKAIRGETWSHLPNAVTVWPLQRSGRPARRPIPRP